MTPHYYKDDQEFRTVTLEYLNELYRKIAAAKIRAERHRREAIALHDEIESLHNDIDEARDALALMFHPASR